MTGSSAVGKRSGLQTNVLVFAPVGGGVVDAQRDGAPLGMERGEDHSREVGTVTVVLSPGSTAELVVTVLGPVGGTAAPDVVPSLVLTPGVTPWVTSVEPYRACGATTG